MAVVAEVVHRERELKVASVVVVPQRERLARNHVGPAGLAAGAASPTEWVTALLAVEHLLKDIEWVVERLPASTAKAALAASAVPHALSAELVEHAAALRVAQHLVRLADLNELVVCLLVVRVLVRVELLRQLPVRRLDLLVAGALADAQDLVVVLCQREARQQRNCQKLYESHVWINWGYTVGKVCQR